jgi:hypothetical protein
VWYKYQVPQVSASAYLVLVSKEQKMKKNSHDPGRNLAQAVFIFENEFIAGATSDPPSSIPFKI